MKGRAKMATVTKRPKLVLSIVICIVLIVALVVAGFYWNRNRVAQAATQQQYQQLMSLTALNNPTTAAPGFQLTDQNGKTVSLSSLKGKVVVLDFMDPVCTDICPIVSAEIVKANQLLGSDRNDVEFLAVNVNQYHESQPDIRKFSKAHGLSNLSNWHFLTGNTTTLKAIWKAYGIKVVPNPTGDVEHTSFMYFIGKDGTEAYVANPDNSKSKINEWARGIQYVSEQLV